MLNRIVLTCSLTTLITAIPAIAQDSTVKKKFLQHSQVVGNKKCIECHESEIKAWQKTKHYHNKDLHTNEKAATIARKMGITSAAKIRTSGLCTQCHFTVQKIGTAPAKAIDGVSCESCHGGAKEWLDLHNIADRREPGDTPAKRSERVAKSIAAGMLYPDQIHQVAENCYSCHIVTDEKLVNVGGHPPGSTDFELASWAAGEVRHNFFLSKGTKNAETPTNGGACSSSWGRSSTSNTACAAWPERRRRPTMARRWGAAASAPASASTGSWRRWGTRRPTSSKASPRPSTRRAC